MKQKTRRATGYVLVGLLGLGVVLPWRSWAQTLTAASLQAEAQTLRARGPAGLQTFLQRHLPESSSQPAPLPPVELRAALDQLCQMKDCYATQLYWYTDLAAAQAAAKASGKPILSLRLLGQLDQDLSCANSRLFRVTLYPDPAINKLLKEQFILHWQSERPVPKVTVDYGDGRTLERTLTGNSIHYILDAQGRPLEALPGLYSPQAFLGQLQQSLNLYQQFQQQPAGQQAEFLRQYHRNRLSQLQTEWARDLSRLELSLPPRLSALSQPSSRLANRPTIAVPPTAMTAGQLTISKLAIEAPLLGSMQLAAANQQMLAEMTDKAAWHKLAALYPARLAARSIALIAHKKASIQAATSAVNLPALVQNLQASIALDTVRNQYLLHGQLHQWFSQASNTSDLPSLNAQVYSRLFLTPASDPWLGLQSPESFSALDRDGLRLPPTP